MLAAAGCLLIAVVGPAAEAEPNAGAPQGSPTPLFSISKSENRNQVQYVIRLDDHCAPAGDAPVYAFWRMLEKGGTTEGLLPREQKAYGIASQAVVERGVEGGKVRVALNALPARPIVVETRRHNGVCVALSTVSIDGAPAHLYNVHARVKWPFGLDYLLLQGWSMDGSRVVREKLEG
jgi:hypothetical protein